MVIVQGITTRWTKASRGAPQSTVRASVPEAAALPASFRSAGGALVHALEAREDAGFELEEQRSESVTDLPLTAFGVRVDRADGLVVVTRLASRWGGWPPRERPRVVLRLANGEWGRCVRNARIGGAREWQYERVVVNVARVDAPTADLFVTTEPAHLVNEEAHLR